MMTIDEAIKRSEPPPGRSAETQILRGSWKLACGLFNVPGFADSATSATLADVVQKWHQAHQEMLTSGVAVDEIETEFLHAWEKRMTGKAKFVFDDVIKWAQQQAQDTDKFQRVSHRLRVLAFVCQRLQRVADEKAGKPESPFYLSQTTAAEAMSRFTRGGSPDGSAGKNGLCTLERRGIIHRVTRGTAWEKKVKGQPPPKSPRAATFLFLGDTQVPESDIPF